MYKVFCLKELCGAINWKQLSGGNYVEGNYPGVIIHRTIIQAPIVRVAILLGAIVWWAIIRGQLSGGQLGANCPDGNFLGGNCPGAIIGGGDNYPGAIVWVVIIQGVIVLEPYLIKQKIKSYKLHNFFSENLQEH